MKNKNKLKCFLSDKKCSFPFKGKNIKFAFKFNKLTYLKCETCMLSFQTILQDDIKKVNEKVAKFYNRKYFYKTYKENNLMFFKRRTQYKIDKKYLVKNFDDSANKKILDYGCGNGEFLTYFKSKKYGYEFNKEADKKSKVKYLNYNEISKFKYDAIIMRGVIEHVPEFYKVLKLLFRCLKKGGIFFITATPNNLCLPYFIKAKNFHLNNPRHIYHFNHINLGSFFLKNNFLNVQVVFQYNETPYKDYNSNFSNLRKKNKSTEAHPGNMMTLSFKKMK